NYTAEIGAKFASFIETLTKAEAEGSVIEVFVVFCSFVHLLASRKTRKSKSASKRSCFSPLCSTSRNNFFIELCPNSRQRPRERIYRHISSMLGSMAKFSIKI